MIFLRRAALILLAAATVLYAPPVQASRSEGLLMALEDQAALRSLFFVRGMSCRACTILIDRSLNSQEGVYWSRFNYPLRTLVIYHVPEKFSSDTLERFIGKAGELALVPMKSEPAAGYRYGDGDPVATWEGGSLTPAGTRRALGPFEKTIADYGLQEGTEEWRQIVYEVSGEEVRNRIFREQARGWESRGWEAEAAMPVMIAKDFYWPTDLLKPTPEEAAVALFLREEVILDDETEIGRKRFDTWLLNLWKEISLDFRGEFLELPGALPGSGLEP